MPIMRASAIATLQSARNAVRIMLSGTASDAHTWNLVVVQLILEELGHSVTNLGPCTPDLEIATRCETDNPDLLIIGSINGHGRQDGLSLIREIRSRPALQRLPVVIGGMLSTDGTSSAAKLLSAGYNSVIEGKVGADRLNSYITALTTVSGARSAGEAPCHGISSRA